MAKASVVPTKGNWMSYANTRMNPWPEKLGMKIVPKLNHDLFSFTKAMKEGWQMNGRWKEGGLVIELFKTTRASMKFDRMIPSGSSWLMGMIQFPPEMDENWVRYGLAKLGQISKLPNWQKIVVLCVHNTTSALNS